MLMIDADADVLTAHSDEPIQTADVRASVASLRRTLLNSGNTVEELVASVGAMHPHHLYVLIYSLNANIVCRWTFN